LLLCETHAVVCHGELEWESPRRRPALALWLRELGWGLLAAVFISVRWWWHEHLGWMSVQSPLAWQKLDITLVGHRPCTCRPVWASLKWCEQTLRLWYKAMTLSSTGRSGFCPRLLRSWKIESLPGCFRGIPQLFRSKLKSTPHRRLPFLCSYIFIKVPEDSWCSWNTRWKY